VASPRHVSRPSPIAEWRPAAAGYAALRLGWSVPPWASQSVSWLRSVNEGVPLPVIQRVLDHASIAMTARYAHLDDETVKREIMSFHERVNIRGERIALATDGPLGEAAWMKERIARAKTLTANRAWPRAREELALVPADVPQSVRDQSFINI